MIDSGSMVEAETRVETPEELQSLTFELYKARQEVLIAWGKDVPLKTHAERGKLSNQFMELIEKSPSTDTFKHVLKNLFGIEWWPEDEGEVLLIKALGVRGRIRKNGVYTPVGVRSQTGIYTPAGARKSEDILYKSYMDMGMFDDLDSSSYLKAWDFEYRQLYGVYPR